MGKFENVNWEASVILQRIGVTRSAILLWSRWDICVGPFIDLIEEANIMLEDVATELKLLEGVNLLVYSGSKHRALL